MVPKRVFQKDRFGGTVVVDAGTRGIAEVEAKARPHMRNLDRAAAGILRNRTGAESAIRGAYGQTLKSAQRFAPSANCCVGTVLYITLVREQPTGGENIAAFRKIPERCAEVVMHSKIREVSCTEAQ
jgi:hypothetical protein